MVGNNKLAIIARMDDSGLGHQTRNLVRLLKPDKVLAIDFAFYNGFKQHPEWYEKYNTKYISGFIQDQDARELAAEVDIILTAETFYNNHFIEIANEYQAITVNQINYEFFEPLLNRSLLLPTQILMPSYWHLEDLQAMTIPGKVEYLPPPTFIEDFNEVRDENMKSTGKRKYLHVAGKMAAHDRAGTKDLIAAMAHAKEDFELVIKVQSGEILATNDPRIVLDYSFPEDERELYRGFDAMIQPRRYAGLNLPMNEALASGLPVIMTNIEPNNRILPEYWLVDSYHVTSFIARTPIDVFSADHQKLGQMLDKMTLMDKKFLEAQKIEAYLVAKREFDNGIIWDKWDRLMYRMGVQ
jgi:glycosyltransferase involved in cell wall biosynthesis